MKTNSTSPSAPTHRSPSEGGFLIPRILLGVTLCLWIVWVVAALTPEEERVYADRIAEQAA